MFNKSDLQALITTALIILLGYAAMQLFIFLDEYLKLTNY
jgi:hypothetical protein